MTENAHEQMQAMTDKYRRLRIANGLVGITIAAVLFVVGMLTAPWAILTGIFVLGAVSARMADLRRAEDQKKIELLAKKIDALYNDSNQNVKA